MMGYVACLSLAVFSLLSITYVVYSLDYFNSVNASLEDELDIIQKEYETRGLKGLEVLEQRRRESHSFGRLAYVLVDKKKEKLSGDLAGWPDYFTWSDGWYTFEMAFSDWRGKSSLFNFVARTREMNDGTRLMVARVADDIRQNIQLVSATLFWSMVIMSILGLIGAVIISHMSLARVEEINRTIRTIMDGNLSDRIPVAAREDDFQTLAINLNAMFERIESSMNDVRQVSDNIAHDLRTPLTRIRNKLSMIGKTATLENQAIHKEILTEADGLLSTFSALLRISQIESGTKKSKFSPFDLSRVFEDVCELYEPLSQVKSINMQTVIQADLMISGDKDLMFQMLANLVDNAIKYTHRGGHISVKGSRVRNKIRLRVSDDGPGVEEDKMEKVFQRFYRTEASRGLQPGNGLGLSMVKAVAELHSGFITLSDSHQYFSDLSQPGLTVTVDLPLYVPIQPAVS